MPDQNLDFDMQQYLKLTGADQQVKIGDEPTLDVLNALVRHHVMSVPYQNYNLLVTRKVVDFSIQNLMNILLVKKRGGNCYEMCEFMLFILESFNFDARRVSSFVLVNNREHTGDVIYNHNVIIVHLNDKKYLVDIGFSQNSLREPVEFSFEETEEKSVTPIEKYLLECNEDHYKLNMWLKGIAWAPMYRFKRPIQYMDEKALAENYNAFMTSPRIIHIRDKIMKFGIVTETGRIGCWCAFDAATRHGTPPYSVLIGENHEIPKSQRVSYDVFRDTIQKHVNIKLNDDYFEEEGEEVA